LIATIVYSARRPYAVKHSGTWLGDQRKELRDVLERGVEIWVKNARSGTWHGVQSVKIIFIAVTII